MNTQGFTSLYVHSSGDSVTHAIARWAGRLTALLLLAGTSLRRRRALSADPPIAHSGAFNYRFKV